MQFPLRDFFWLSLVIGLTIGIAIERKQSMRLSVHEGRAQWWEKAAREIGERFEKATGEPVQFEEMKHLEISIPNRMKTVRVRDSRGEIIETKDVVPGYQLTSVVYVRDTRQRDLSWVTGMIDLDMFLLMLVTGGPFFLVYAYRNKGEQPLTIANRDAPIWKEKPWFALWWVPACVLMSLMGYMVQRSPFTGALFLFQGVLWTYYYCEYVLVPRLNPDRAGVATMPGSN